MVLLKKYLLSYAYIHKIYLQACKKVASNFGIN